MLFYSSLQHDSYICQKPDRNNRLKITSVNQDLSIRNTAHINWTIIFLNIFHNFSMQRKPRLLMWPHLSSLQLMERGFGVTKTFLNETKPSSRVVSVHILEERCRSVLPKMTIFWPTKKSLRKGPKNARKLRYFENQKEGLVVAGGRCLKKE